MPVFQPAPVLLLALLLACPLGASPRPATATVVGPSGNMVLKLRPEVKDSPELRYDTAIGLERLSLAKPMDKVQVVLEDGGPVVLEIKGVTRETGAGERILALFLGLALVLGPASFFSGWRPQRFLVAKDDRYSNSQVQLVVWFTALASVYVAAFALRLSWGQGLIGGIELPMNLLALSGLSALTFGGAKIITKQKMDTAATDQVTTAKDQPAVPNLVNDLVQNDLGKVDFGDFQMLLVTCAAVVIFVLSAFHFLGAMPVTASIALPDVDTTLLSAFGLGQGAYLLKKAALKPGEG